MSIGPTRLVLIRSGKYEFGEVELIRPLHLIGPNNVGKTSLISTLQFLYIDQQQKMHFARDLEQTRKYYFPDPDSYILFECLSPTGYRVLGVHGLGPVKSYAFERFSYSGELKLDDFIGDERQVRPNNEIRSRLSNREYTVLEPTHLKAALTGIGENKGVRLELLPMRDRGGYERFRKVFSNLLRLAHISQEELKRFLYEIYETEFQQSSIDLESSYSSQYEKVRVMANEVKDLKAVAEDIRIALSLAKERDILRSELPQLFGKIREGVEQAEKQSSQAKTTLQEERSQLAAKLVENENKQKNIHQQLREMNEALGVVKNDLKKLNEEKTEFASYLVSFEEVNISNLRATIEDIGYRLKNSTAEPVRRVEARIQKNEADLKKQKDLLSTVSNSVVHYLKQNYSEEEIIRVFQLLNHDLLGMAVVAGEIEIQDPGKLNSDFLVLRERIDGNVYSDEAVHIEFPASLQPELHKYSDPAVITARIEDLQAELEKDRSTLQAARESEQLSKKKNAAADELRKLENRHLKYLSFHEKCKSEKEWEKDLRKKEIQQSELERIQDELTNKNNSYKNQDRECARQLAKLTEKEEILNRQVRALTPPDPDWKIIEPLSSSPLKVEDLISEYGNRYDQERRKRENLADKLDAIESKTYSRIKGETERETLELLAEELEALTQKEEAVEKLWSGLTANLQTAIKNMLKDLETLKSRVEHLNRQLGKVSVSNLSRLKLMLAENHQLVPRLKAVASRHDSPLFAGLQNTDEALSFIGEFLKHSGKIELLQLFELHFEVTIADGPPQRYTKLETIESNGTTITIKVLINLMLLRGLLDDKRKVAIPFYLDEASSLDRENVRSIVEQSVRMGFIPVLASPEAMDVADNLYFLKDRKGQLLLERNALVRISKRSDLDAAHA